jgi:hypothetical protein
VATVFLIDFPLGYLLGPAHALLENFGFFDWFGENRQVIRNVLFPALFFQIVGTIQWTIIVLVLRWVVSLFRTK